MSIFVVVCQNCGREHEPDHQRIVTGDWQRYPQCRRGGTPPPGAPPPPPRPQEEAVRRIPN